VGNVLWCVHCVCAVRTVSRNFGVARHDEREALAVDDVPVERVELVLLVSQRSHPHRCERKKGRGRVLDTHVDPRHRIERALNVRQRETRTKQVQHETDKKESKGK
jgi:hypothetical protein